MAAGSTKHPGAWPAAWLHPLMGTTSPDNRLPRAYLIALRHVTVTLDIDPAWQAWWQGSGVTECKLGIVTEGRLDHLPSADLRMTDDKLHANFTCALPPSAASPPADLLDLATAEVTAMFEVIREALGLAPVPSVPPLPDLPADLRDVEVTTRPVPPAPPELEQQGYLTLAQIREFFG